MITEITETINIGNLNIDYDAKTGQVIQVYDRSLDMEVISFLPGSELEINRVPLPIRLVHQDEPEVGPAWQCMLDGEDYPSCGLSRGFRIFRQMVVGSACKPGGNHLNPPNSLHIRYRLDRRQMDSYTTPDPLSAGSRPIQAPLWLDTVGTFCAKTDWFGPDTKMIAAHFGAAGPRSHVSLEDGPVRDVVPHLWNMYRRVHPGLQTIPGAIYYHEDGRWLWITCQRPSVGMHWDWGVDSQKAQFEYHARLTPAEIIHTPEVSLYWGRGGRPEMMAVLSDAFIGYEEPTQDWWYHTCWHWMHWWGYRPNGFDDMADQAQYLHDEMGLTGFAMTTHDLRPGSWDCSGSGLRPSPHWGGEQGIRRFIERVKSFGGHTFVWLPFMGLAQPGLDLKEHWRIKGEDGRPYESFYIGSFDMYHAVNYGHPEVQTYYLNWIRRYIGDYGVDGIFWDCGGSPFPPDFSDPATRHFQRFPSESMTAGCSFLEKIMQTGRECSKDFFMWHESFSTDLPGTGYSTLTGNDEFAMQLNRWGKKRIVFRSSSTYNLYGGFPFIDPSHDCYLPEAAQVTRESYRPVAEDRMNRWLVKFVREHGCRDAVGLANGVALCASHIVVDPCEAQRLVTVPEWAGRVQTLRDVFTGETIAAADQDDRGRHFLLSGASAYAIEG